LLDGELDGALGNEAKIGTGEAVGSASYEVDVHIVGNRGLAELGFENAGARGFIWEWNVNERIETARTAEGVVKLLWPIRGANDEDVLLGSHAVHFWRSISNYEFGGTVESY